MASTTHFSLGNGRVACRAFSLASPRSCSTIATTKPENVTCKRCLASGRVPTPAPAPAPTSTEAR